MWAKLLALFTIVPILELTLLITVGNYIGLLPTIAIVVTTALAGATLGKMQGLRAWRRIKEELANGELPKDSVLDGLAVLIAAAFLVTPGVLTDVAAFTLLFPVTRKPLKGLIKKRLDGWLGVESTSFFPGFGGGYTDPDVVDMGADSMRHGASSSSEDEEADDSMEVIIEPMPPEADASGRRPRRDHTHRDIVIHEAEEVESASGSS